MAYRILKQKFAPCIVRLILSYHQSYQPNRITEIHNDYISTINYYIVFVVPKARQKFPVDWKKYVRYNPFIQSYLLSRKFYDLNHV